MTNHQEQLQQWTNATKAYANSGSKAVPEFYRLNQAATQEGALSVKVKELMGLALGIAARCDGCILSHTKAAIQNRATMEEIVETVDVALLMGGGPSYMYGGRAIECAKEFLDN